MSHRINVNFSDSVYQALEELAQKRGKTMAEVLRDAVALEKWLSESLEEGARILIERDGNVREMVFR